MFVDVYWVEELKPGALGGDEIARFRSQEKAEAFAKRYAEKHGVVTMVHLAEWEITRRGRECTGGLDNLASFGAQ